MLSWVLGDIICQEFDKNVGRNQDPMFSKKEGTEYSAMEITFRLGRYEGEEGYRHLQIRIYGPQNYVAVLVQEDWIIIPEEDLDNEKDCVKPGKDYTVGNTGWMLASYHESCWRTDGIENIIHAYENHISGLDSLGFPSWYLKVNLNEDERKEIDALIRSRDVGDFSRHWDRKKVQGPLFEKVEQKV